MRRWGEGHVPNREAGTTADGLAVRFGWSDGNRFRLVGAGGLVVSREAELDRATAGMTGLAAAVSRVVQDAKAVLGQALVVRMAARGFVGRRALIGKVESSGFGGLDNIYEQTVKAKGAREALHHR